MNNMQDLLDLVGRLLRENREYQEFIIKQNSQMLELQRQIGGLVTQQNQLLQIINSNMTMQQTTQTHQQSSSSLDMLDGGPRPQL